MQHRAPVVAVVVPLALLFPEGGFEPFPVASFLATVAVVLAFLWALPRDQRLFDGAVLVLEPDHAVVVRVAQERWLRLQPRAIADAIELGYHAGNLHWRVRIAGEALLVAVEAPMDDYLARLGELIRDRRVIYSLADCDDVLL